MYTVSDGAAAADHDQMINAHLTGYANTLLARNIDSMTVTLEVDEQTPLLEPVVYRDTAGRAGNSC